ncbi:hypothetical protein E1B28_005518 [Marasmius oreades]|uniref:Uncharacterized protein n=1 Tax=Marasmius oreades TaxID=181124 RepID=A0A9P7UW63_9AGAR|nr:uncharacterized protein E1B28_005518 [Marasmius oreades]KAG7094699.1 hypothetical protein E1B28_005518 [Marasmius oreades]
MISFFNLLSLVLLLPVAVSAQDFNVTVNETDTTQITYGGGAGDASLCKVDEHGYFIGSQPGCYNVQPQPPCTEFAAMGQQNTSYGSWKFKGSALYIRSLLSDFSPTFNIDIDGKVTEADGAQIGKDSRAFDCFDLFSVQGLDPNIEHIVNMTVKGASPNRNKTLNVITGPFSLISYTYTTNNQTNSSGSQQRSGSNGSQRLLTTFPEILVLFVFSVSGLYLGIV